MHHQVMRDHAPHASSRNFAVLLVFSLLSWLLALIVTAGLSGQGVSPLLAMLGGGLTLILLPALWLAQQMIRHRSR